MHDLTEKVAELRTDLGDLIKDRDDAQERIRVLTPLVDGAKAAYEELRDQLEDATGGLREADDGLVTLRTRVAQTETEFAEEVARQQQDFAEEVAGLREELDDAQTVELRHTK